MIICNPLIKCKFLFQFGWFAHAIFTDKGDYPPIMRKRIDEISRRQGFPRSRLPHFTKEEVENLKHSADFLGLNHYTTYLVSKGNGKISVQPSYNEDMGVVITQKPEWPKSNSTWLRVSIHRENNPCCTTDFFTGIQIILQDPKV